MMTESLPNLAQRCASCDALNQPGARVCAGCGLHLAEYEAAAPHLHDLQRDRETAQLETLQRDASATIAGEVARGRRLLGLQLSLLLGAAVLLVGLIAVASVLAANHARARQERLAAEYQRAAACLEAQDNLCARDGFVAVLAEDASYPEAQAGLTAARSRLARQYAQAGQWEAAITELDTLLKSAPGDRAALTLLKDVYDRWIADADSRGDWWTAGRIRFQRNLRFPPEVRDRRGDVL